MLIVATMTAHSLNKGICSQLLPFGSAVPYMGNLFGGNMIKHLTLHYNMMRSAKPAWVVLAVIWVTPDGIF